MTVENGAAEAANDTAQTAVNDLPQTGDNQTQHTADDGGEGGGQEQVVEEFEFDADGEKVKVPAKLKDYFLRQSDYTKKTMELADHRRALDGEREGFQKQVSFQKEHFQAATKVAALDSQLERYATVDWAALYQTNPDLYQQHRINYDGLKDQRDAAARDLSSKEQEYRTGQERESANRVQKAIAELTRHLPEWTPNGELDRKMTEYGTARGYSPAEMSGLALQFPKVVADLNRLRLYDEAAKNKSQQQTFQQSQQAKPVTRVGANSGGAARKTTDSSGDALSTAEWARREEERMAAKRQAKGGR